MRTLEAGCGRHAGAKLLPEPAVLLLLVLVRLRRPRQVLRRHEAPVATARALRVESAAEASLQITFRAEGTAPEQRLCHAAHQGRDTQAKEL